MNSIHEKDWAEDDWAGHSGMPSNPYNADARDAPTPAEDFGVADDLKNITEKTKKI